MSKKLAMARSIEFPETCLELFSHAMPRYTVLSSLVRGVGIASFSLGSFGNERIENMVKWLAPNALAEVRHGIARRSSRVKS
jgi:hypothetical protein